MATTGTLEVDLVLEASNFMQNMKKAADQSLEFQKSISEAFDTAKEAVVGLGEALAVDYLKDKVAESLEYAESIEKVSEATGATTKFIQEYNYAAGQSGVSTEAADKALEKFTKSLGEAATGNQQLAKLFKDLGVTSSDTQTAVGQFATGLEEVHDKSSQVADITQAFGRNATELVPVLTEGAGHLGELAKAADELGVVLSDSVITNSVEAEHKLTALKEVVDAEWANVIGQNAQAFTELASAMISAAGAAAHFFSAYASGGNLDILHHPLLTSLSSRLLGNDPAKTRADALQGAISNANSRPQLLGEIDQALNELNRADKGQGLDDGLPGFLDAGIDGVGDNAASRFAAHQKLMALRHQVATYRDPTITPEKPAAGITLPGPKPERHHGPSEQDLDRGFFGQLKSATGGLYGAEESLTQDPTALLGLQSDALDQENADKTKQIMATRFSLDAKINAARQQQLVDIQNQTTSDKELALQTAAQDKIASEKLQLLTTDLSIQQTALQSQLELATTARQRKAIQDQIIDLEFQQKEATLKSLLAQQQRDGADADAQANTQHQLDALGAQKSAAQAANARQNAGPLQQLIQTIPQTGDEIDEAMQTVAVDGLKSLQDGLVGIIDGTKNVADAFGDMAKTIIDDIAKIVLEEAIVKPLANGLLGMIGIGASAFGGTTSAGTGAVYGGTLGGLYAGGGKIAGPGTGTSDSILARVSNGEFVVNAAATAKNLGLLHAINDNRTPGFASGGLVGETSALLDMGSATNVVPHRAFASLAGNARGQMTINSTVNGVNDPAMVRAISIQSIAQATPAMLSMSSDNTMKRINYPRMR